MIGTGNPQRYPVCTGARAIRIAPGRLVDVNLRPGAPLPFLLVQSRPERVAADGEFGAFVRYGGFAEGELQRIHIDAGELPPIDLDDWAGIIVGGGPANFAYDDAQKSPEQARFEPWLFDLSRRCVEADHPFLGACLGLGSLVHGLGGRMSFDVSEPVAAVEIEVTDADDPLLEGFPDRFMAFAGHKEGLAAPLEGMRVLARSAACIQLVGVGTQVYATQFHPELDGAGLEERIIAYDGYGYFEPEEASALIAAGHAVTATWPMELLRRFVERARAHARARDRAA